MNPLTKLFDPAKLADSVARLKSPFALVIYLISVIVICATLIAMTYFSFMEAQLQLKRDQAALQEAQKALLAKSKESDAVKRAVDEDIKDTLNTAYTDLQKKLHASEVSVLKLDLRIAALEKENAQYGYDMQRMMDAEAERRLERREAEASAGMGGGGMGYGFGGRGVAMIVAGDPPQDGPDEDEGKAVAAYVSETLEDDSVAPEPPEPPVTKKLKFKKAKRVDWDAVPEIEGLKR